MVHCNPGWAEFHLRRPGAPRSDRRRRNARPGKAVRDAAAAVPARRRRDDRPGDPAPCPRAEGPYAAPRRQGEGRSSSSRSWSCRRSRSKRLLQPTRGPARRDHLGPPLRPDPGPPLGPDDHRRDDRRAHRPRPMAAAPHAGAGRQRRRSRGRPVRSTGDGEAGRVHGARRPAQRGFPRGLAFPGQVDRADFREAWDALDGATRTLEGDIADDRRLGLGIATAARRPPSTRAVAWTRCSGWPTTAARRPGSDRRHAMTTTRQRGSRDERGRAWPPRSVECPTRLAPRRRVREGRRARCSRSPTRRSAG